MIQCENLWFSCLEGGRGHKCNDSAAEINQFLQNVAESKFLDVLIPVNQIVRKEYLGKGMNMLIAYLKNII